MVLWVLYVVLELGIRFIEILRGRLERVALF